MPEAIDLDQLEADAQAAAPRMVSLAEVRALAERQKLLEEELAALEAQVVVKKQELKQVAEIELPELLTLVGLPSITLADGSVIEIADNISASITDENRGPAHAWFREIGAGDLIKNIVSVTFGKGEDEYAQLLVHNIQVMADQDAIKYGTLDQKESIHPSTLKAFVKERLKAGEPLPAETLKLYIGQTAKIKKPKVRA
jgi:hypothetical protein